MDSLYEKRSVSMAASAYRARQKERRLKIQLSVFLVSVALISGTAAALITKLPF